VNPDAGGRAYQDERHNVLIPNQTVKLPCCLLVVGLTDINDRNNSFAVVIGRTETVNASQPAWPTCCVAEDVAVIGRRLERLAASLQIIGRVAIPQFVEERVKVHGAGN
jgi:hypothetical protein